MELGAISELIAGKRRTVVVKMDVLSAGPLNLTKNSCLYVVRIEWSVSSGGNGRMKAYTAHGKHI
jgi:hypothetical protein